MERKAALAERQARLLQRIKDLSTRVEVHAKGASIVKGELICEHIAR